MLIDKTVIVGSSNMNHRSTLHDVELDIELFSEESRLIMEKGFLELILKKELTSYVVLNKTNVIREKEKEVISLLSEENNQM